MPAPRFQVILHQPEIPPNTGNIMRLCANCGAELHLIEPLGFALEEKALRRAGLDYRDQAMVRTWATLEHCLENLADTDGTRGSDRDEHRPALYACTTRGDTTHTEPVYEPGDRFLFGAESRGLPKTILDDPRIGACLRLPMQPGSRSLNLSNAVAVVIYEAWRQIDFAGATR